MSHRPGIGPKSPARQSVTVRAAPAISGGKKLYRNLRTGADHSGNPAARAFRSIERKPITMATAPSASQLSSQRAFEAASEAIPDAARAVAPIATPPQPGTAVKEP